jgi:hypothetical protein
MKTPRMALWIPLIALVFAASPAMSQTHVALLFGVDHPTDDEVESSLGNGYFGGFNVSLELIEDVGVGVEAGGMQSRNGGDDDSLMEIFEGHVGLRVFNRSDQLPFVTYVALGYSFFDVASVPTVADPDIQGFGGYLRTGVYWAHPEHKVSFGADLRYRFGTTMDSLEDGLADALQFSISLGWSL